MKTNENREAGERPLSRGRRTALVIISHAAVSADTDTGRSGRAKEQHVQIIHNTSLKSNTQK